ncbi:MAG: TRAP transporter small permease [Candidatus Methylomirabilota bacterium]
MRPFTKMLDAIERIQDNVVWLLYVAMIVLVNFQVLNRFILQWPIVWTADLSIVLFVWIGFLTSSNAIRRKTHFRMSLLVDVFSRGAARRSFEFFALLCVFILAGVLIYEGMNLVRQGLREISPGLETSMAWSYAAIPLSMLTSFLFAIEKLVVDVVQGGSPAGEEAR